MLNEIVTFTKSSFNNNSLGCGKKSFTIFTVPILRQRILFSCS
ncbi:MAG: hypothetical protein O7D30_02780 [Rickettsia endosymbiont of Ixodes persulcatus]|nr:hypothetical protein [Rickettsia endosymbiont of Ixodes persulcatus]